DARMLDELAVEIVLVGQRQLQHHRLIRIELVELLANPRLQQRLRARLVRAVNVDFRLDDRDEPRLQDSPRVFELLLDDRTDALLVGLLYDRSHLRSEDVLALRFREERIEIVDRLPQLNAVALGREALVDLEDRPDVLHLLKVIGRRPALDLAVHRALEEDRAEDAAAVERRARDDPPPHLMDEIEHLLLGGPGALVDAVETQRLRRAAPALVQCSDESLLAAHLSQLCLEVAHGIPL